MSQLKVAVVMGSDSDWPVMQFAVEYLEQFGISYEAKVVSAHRTPDLLAEFGKDARDNNFSCIIAGAGGAAHLPGMLAANTTIPVLGVPVPTEHLHGEDSLLSIVQMPKGIPVATFAIGKAGAINAALFAISMLAVFDPDLAAQLEAFREGQRAAVHQMTLPPTS
jgi:5-(carboxyamino)imidazole ribonucleotide mutase